MSVQQRPSGAAGGGREPVALRRGAGRRLVAAVALLTAVSWAAAGCGAEDASEEPAGATARTAPASTGSAGPSTDPARVAFRPVLQVLGQVSPGSSRTSTERQVSALRRSLGLPDGVPAQELLVAAQDGRGMQGVDLTDARFSQLLELESSLVLVDAITPAGSVQADAEVVLADSEGTVFRLGPTLLDGSVVESTTAVRVGDTWTVQLLLRRGQEGVDQFNDVAAACYRGEPTCPDQAGGRGRLAVVVDGTVLSAPSIQEPSFRRDGIQIGGSFSRSEAEQLAARLGGR